MHMISNLRKKLERRKGEIESLSNSIISDKKEIKRLKKKQEILDKALIVAQEVQKITNRKLNDSLSELVTLAMQSVLEEPYELHSDFVIRRGKIEVDLYAKKEDKLYNPFSCGGGTADVMSLGLRFSSYILQSKPRTRPIIIIDEPNTYLKGNEMPEKGAAIIKTMSEKLGLQIIMVSHDLELINSADKVIEVDKKNNISSVKES